MRREDVAVRPDPERVLAVRESDASLKTAGQRGSVQLEKASGGIVNIIELRVLTKIKYLYKAHWTIWPGLE